MTKCGWMAVASRQFDSSTPKFSSIISERSQPGGQGDRRASLGRKLLGLGPRHAYHGGLRQVVEERHSVVVLVVLGGSIRHLDYQTALVVDKEWQCEVAGDDVRVYGEPQHPKASLQGVLPHWHVPLEEALRPPHVVDQHVQTALLILDAPHESPHLLRFEMVDPNGDATTARPIDEFGRLLDRLGTVILRALIARGSASDVYCGPRRAELDGDPPPGPTRTSSHQGHLPFQLRHHRALLPITSTAYKVHPDRIEHCNVLPPKEALDDPVGQRP